MIYILSALFLYLDSAGIIWLAFPVSIAIMGYTMVVWSTGDSDKPKL